MEALRARRCFGTTGDKMVMEFKLDGVPGGATAPLAGPPEVEISVKGQRPLEKVELLRNSRVIKEFPVSAGDKDFSLKYADPGYREEKDVLYYYARATQENGELAWSSPVWIDRG